MLDKLTAIDEKYEELNHQLELHAEDYLRVVELAKERAEIEPVVTKSREYRDALRQIEDTRELQNSEDPEFREMATAELSLLEEKVEILENELKTLLLPGDARDSHNVIIEIRAGTGGDEAGLFAADLFRMYTRYAERQKWKYEILSQNETGIGGFKEIVFVVKGQGAFSHLKYESGVHRVQRVPTTESSGRIHTSTITVAVLAEVEDVDIHIPDTDIKIDVYKSAGAGGQSVQKNSTAVRITHAPSGIVVACQDERSQLQNKLRAMGILRAKLYELKVREQQEELDKDRKSQVGTGERAEKIRTYNYPQSRVTDHRINFTSHNLSAVLEGELDHFIEELSVQEEADRLAMAGV